VQQRHVRRACDAAKIPATTTTAHTEHAGRQDADPAALTTVHEAPGSVLEHESVTARVLGVEARLTVDDVERQLVVSAADARRSRGRARVVGVPQQ